MRFISSVKKYQSRIFLVLLGVLVWWAAHSLGLFASGERRGLENLFLLAQEAFPPDTSIITVAVQALWETLAIAFVGTMLGATISLPLALLASRNICSRAVTVPARVVLAALRSLPALLWAVLFVIMYGLGAWAGVCAIASYTVGYMAKLIYESIEGMQYGPIEAVRALGANRVQIIRFVVLPESANYIISQLLFMFEYNVRASSILGFVGAGGIGLYVMGYLKFLEYDKVLTLLLLIFCTVIVLDVMSVFLRDRFVRYQK